jgi:hypothetical protein
MLQSKTDCARLRHGDLAIPYYAKPALHIVGNKNLPQHAIRRVKSDIHTATFVGKLPH